MSNFLDPVKMALREAMSDTLSKTETQRISQAFRNGMAVGLFVGCILASFGWVTHFWLISLSR